MIKVLVPLMPTADQLLPYLRQIDVSRVYVKNGDMVKRLQSELEDLVQAPCTLAANGTVAIELALRSLGLPPGSGVLAPAVTFVATGQAIVNAGLQPVICDVDDSWELNAWRAREICIDDPTIRCVLPVAAFGRAVIVDPWEEFYRLTRIPVLIDAAGAVYDQGISRVADMMVTVSLNATKALGAGEGGAVFTWDVPRLERIASLANFGPGGTNARMSEYHAAVALASLQQTAPDWRAAIHGRYAERLPEQVKIIGGMQSRRTLYPVLLPEGVSPGQVSQAMALAGIETKAWYRPFLDERAEFITCRRVGPINTYLPNTERLRDRLLGLPFHAFMTADDVELVCNTLHEILA